MFNYYLDSPPTYGFLPNLRQQECPQNNTPAPDMYSGVALSYGMPIPYQQQQSSNLPTPESPQTTPYPLTNPYPNLTSETQSTLSNESLDSSALKIDSSGKLIRN